MRRLVFPVKIVAPPKILAPKKIALTEGAPVKSVNFYKIYQLYDGGFVYWQIIKMKF